MAAMPPPPPSRPLPRPVPLPTPSQSTSPSPSQATSPSPPGSAGGAAELRPGFWEDLPLEALTAGEWEALCDGCGRCCSFVLEDEVTGELFATRVACRLLDRATCRCADYPNRTAHVSWCIQITPGTAARLDWLPASCAYRLRAAGQPLPPWHHLVCGDREAVHRDGPSLRGQLVGEDAAGDDFERYIID